MRRYENTTVFENSKSLSAAHNPAFSALFLLIYLHVYFFIFVWRMTYLPTDAGLLSGTQAFPKHNYQCVTNNDVSALRI
jgi:hypothetical protein